MDIYQLDKDLIKIALKKNELDLLNYDDEEYDRVEEEVHSLEDSFQDQYGEYLEEKLADVHDEYCSDNDVLIPIAYIANKYILSNEQFNVDVNQGVQVDVDDYPQKKTRLVLIPKPTRIVLIVDENTQNVVWEAKP